MERFIDVAVEQFARDHTEPETDLYVRLREETYRVMKWPEMQVDAIEGRFLKMLVRLTGARSVLMESCLRGNGNDSRWKRSISSEDRVSNAFTRSATVRDGMMLAWKR